MSRVTRRAFIGGGAAVATTAAISTLPGGLREALAGERRQGNIGDVKHVVVLMQENRSFDHYLGSLNGVRGFDDKRGLRLPNGGYVFRQPDASRPDGGAMLPYRMNTTKYNAQNAAGLPHDWGTGHQAWNSGAWNQWVAAKGQRSMGHFVREDLPFQYALADAFTVCDHYFCSQNGPTDPNRLYLWSGTAGPGVDGTTGPWTDNTPVPTNPVANWTTYAERLEAAHVSWRVYHNPSINPWDGDYDDNALAYFEQFHKFDKQSSIYVNAMTKWDLGKFADHCKDGSLPTVSWIVAPFVYCEHPWSSPAYGADYVNTVLQALFANPEIWASTVFLLMYDENDGYFDHVVPPVPEAGTPNEFADGRPIGLGARVPLWVISPWSRGGWVNSQVFDHTSVLRFLEVITGVQEPNISAWRRAVCGDLTSCFDFESPDATIPALPDTKALRSKADIAWLFPAVPLPAEGQQKMPVQETGARLQRPIAWQPNAYITLDRPSGKVICTMTNAGEVGFHFTIYPNKLLPFAGTPFTVPAGGTARYVWDTTQTGGVYDFSVYGANGFVRDFAGTLTAGASRSSKRGMPEMVAMFEPGPALHQEDSPTGASNASVWLTLSNAGRTVVRFTVTPNDFGGTPQTYDVAPFASVPVEWPTSDGWYDITVTSNTTDGFTQRLAGHVEPTI